MKIILAILCSQVLSAADQPAALSGPGLSLSLTRLLEQFDTNNDGKLSAEERAAFDPLMTAASDLYSQQPKDDAASGIRPSAAKILAQTDKLLPFFDKDNNGILDEKEKEQAGFAAAVVQRWSPDFDNNYDGRLDANEQSRLTKAWNDYLDMLTRNAATVEEPKGSHQITGGKIAPGGALAGTGSKTDKLVNGGTGTGSAAGIPAKSGNGQAAARIPGHGAMAGGQGAGPGKVSGNKPAADGKGPGSGGALAGNRSGHMGNGGARNDAGGARPPQKPGPKQVEGSKKTEMRPEDQKAREALQQERAKRKKKLLQAPPQPE